MNAKEHRQYIEVFEALALVLYNLPGKLIAIDGRPGVGKTTLGRYLAWRFNVSLLETDLFLIKGQGKLVYFEDQLTRIIDARLSSERPIIVEGIAVLRLLEQLERHPDYVVFVSSTDGPDLGSLKTEVRGYERQFKPKTRANLHITLDHPSASREALETFESEDT